METYVCIAESKKYVTDNYVDHIMEISVATQYANNSAIISLPMTNVDKKYM